jgi:hypothetical protein
MPLAGLGAAVHSHVPSKVVLPQLTAQLAAVTRYIMHRAHTHLVIVANIMEQCSLFLPLQRGAGPMALMLWLDWVT